MRVLMFQERFAEAVADRRKRQTIRPLGKRPPPREGETLSLRKWSGVPYRSPHMELRKEVCRSVQSIRLWHGRPPNVHLAVLVQSCALADEEIVALARADGFRDPWDMLMWFFETHGLPFEGLLITW